MDVQDLRFSAMIGLEDSPGTVTLSGDIEWFAQKTS